MTWKNAAAGLPHGGCKSVIAGDPRMPTERKEQIIRAFAGAIRDLTDYVPGPDMGTDELCMGWIDVAALIALKDAGRPLRDYPHGRKLDVDAIIDVDCDIWIPAARPDVVRADNVARLKTRLMPQGANIPCTAEA